MPGKVTEVNNLNGLSQQQIPSLQEQYGKNIFAFDTENRFLKIVWGIFREPMFILLVIACSLYFILGNTGEGIMMAVAMAIVTAISLYQEVKSSKALAALKQLKFSNNDTIVVCLSGRGDKDLATYMNSSLMRESI